jgi:hypothetical protein
LHKPVPVIAFERTESLVFPSISVAATAYGVNKKIILDRINDGTTLKDGYTTLDWYSSPEETKNDLENIQTIVQKNFVASI